MFHANHVRWLSNKEVFGRFLELRCAIKPSVSERPAGYPEVNDCNWIALMKAAGDMCCVVNDFKTSLEGEKLSTELLVKYFNLTLKSELRRRNIAE
jgi:hypothetical protein